jgi:hypothetical protein
MPGGNMSRQVTGFNPIIASRGHRGQIPIFEFQLIFGLIDQIKLLAGGNSGGGWG